jgi:hypothetical protein
MNMNVLLAHGDLFLRHLDQLTDRLKQLDVATLDQSLVSLNSILAKIDHGNGSLGAFVNDPDLYDAAKSLMGEANSNRIVRNLVRQGIKDADDKAAEKAAQLAKDAKTQGASAG